MKQLSHKLSPHRIVCQPVEMLYLVTMNIIKKWIGHRQDWGQIHSQLEIYFEERLIGRNL